MDGIRECVIAGRATLAYWCKGCRTIHWVPVDGSRGWAWNAAAQTLHPSVRHHYTGPGDEVEGVKHTGPRDVTTCHYFIRNGRIEFLNDCQHALKGQTLPLDEAPPANYGGRETFGWT